MTRIDQFESVFKSADKEVFRYEPLAVRSVLIVTDLEEEGTRAFEARVRAYLKELERGGPLSWKSVPGGAFSTVRGLMDLVEDEGPDLVCSYRNLHTRAWQWTHSLGSYLDVLTQVSRAPVLVTPHPEAGREAQHALRENRRVMAITDDLLGDGRLVNHAVGFTEPGGTLLLTHVEDESVFERYVEVVSKIPTIDTETAREEVCRQLLKEPRDYIRSCREELEEKGVPVEVEEIVTMGHRLSEYVRLIEERGVDLLVLNTKDEDQSAMHGMAYPLAVGVRNIPLLML